MPLFSLPPHAKRSPFVKQKSLAAFLPSEILIAVLRFLEPHPRDRPDSYLLAPYLPEHPIHAASLVCKAWNPAATIVLYEYIHIASERGLRMLLFLSRLRFPLRSLVHSIMFKSSLPNNDDIHTIPRAKREVDIIAKSCSAFPNLSELRLQLRHPSSTTLMSHQTITGTKLSSLHLVGRPLTTLSSSLKFPVLQDLTLENFVVNAEFMWPQMPHIRVLRLHKCYLGANDNAPRLHAMANLQELELVQIIAGGRALFNILQAVSSTLESLTVVDFNTYTFDYDSDMDDLTFLMSLRRLCVGPLWLAFKATRSLPVSLRCLTVWELDYKDLEYCAIVLPSIPYNVECLLQLLNTEKESYLPNLEMIRVHGEEWQWSGWREYITKRCEEFGVRFHLQTFEDPEFRDIRVRRRKLRYQYVRRILRRLT